jgi:hypothetical protein
MVYRGQRNATWGLTPSLTRELQCVCEAETAIISREKELLRSLKKAAHLYLDVSSRAKPASDLRVLTGHSNWGKSMHFSRKMTISIPGT